MQVAARRLRRLGSGLIRGLGASGVGLRGAGFRGEGSLKSVLRRAL